MCVCGGGVLAVTVVFVCSTEVCVLIRLSIERTRASGQKHRDTQKEKGRQTEREREAAIRPKLKKYLNYIRQGDQ